MDLHVNEAGTEEAARHLITPLDGNDDDPTRIGSLVAATKSRWSDDGGSCPYNWRHGGDRPGIYKDGE